MNLKNYLVFLLAVLIPLFVSAQVTNRRAPNANDPFERMFIAEKVKLDRLFNFPTDLLVSDSEDIHAERNVGIILNIAQIKKYITKSKYKDTMLIVRLIMAHEKTHFVQFLFYPQSMQDNFNDELRRVAECQADIIAAKYLVESYMDTRIDEMYNNTYTDSLKTGNHVGLDLFYAIGESAYSKNVHPTREQRRYAFKVGNIYGQFNIVSAYLQKYGNKIPQASKTLFELELKKLYTSAFIRSGEGEAVMAWAFVQAKRICHYSAVDMANVTFAYKKVDWEKVSNYNRFNYSFDITNHSPDALIINFDVRIDLAPASDPDNSFASKIFVAHQYPLVVDPGKTQSVSASIDGPVFLTDEHAKKTLALAIFPGQKGCGLFVEKRDVAPQTVTRDAAYMLDGAGAAYQDVANLSLLFETIRMEAHSDFETLVAMPGIRDNTNPQLADKVIYECFSAGSEVKLIKAPNAHYRNLVRFGIAASSSLVEAKNIYQNTMNKINQNYVSEISDGTIVPMENKDLDNISLRSFRFKNPVNEMVYSFVLEKYPSMNKYLVSIVFTRTDPF